MPTRVDPTGESGPTWRQANGRGFRKTGVGLYVPAEAPECVEQRIVEQAARLRPDGSSGCVTAWAALRWRGAAYFDGLSEGALEPLPVPLALGGAHANLRPSLGCTISRARLAPTEREVVDGVPVATVQRALFDEVRRRGELWAAVTAIDMTAAAGLISTWLFAAYVADLNSRNGAPLARHAASLAVDESWSPREPWMRLVWQLVAGLEPPLVNEPVYDLDGKLVGIPDLFDPVAGLAGEYNGEHHKEVTQARDDVAREERFRNHGIECFAVVRGDTRGVAAARMLAARGRAKFLPPESRAWTVERPPWDTAPETLDDRFVRLGMVEELTHH
ncbi:hypothetical protein [Nocardioides sp.]|uniref:hypothetical protein n=1 Tax=Nocardioides sp. TaxID=35761 RepID=UPI002D7F0C14|nr:hypothetical protein [Nocardioides sp.]